MRAIRGDAGNLNYPKSSESRVRIQSMENNSEGNNSNYKFSSESYHLDPPPKLPKIMTGAEIMAFRHAVPPELVGGILHQGCKLVLGSTAKSFKTWCLLDLALSVASGQPWLGRPTVAGKVLYVNFELPSWAFKERLEVILKARPQLKLDDLAVWHLRGHAADISDLRPKIQCGMARRQFALITIDPAYKLLGDRDENSNGDIAELMNEFEAIAQFTGAAIVIAHHFAKGNPSAKDPIDRLCGAGAWIRDPDAVLVLTPHEEDGCYTVSSILREFPPLPEFVVEWQYPVMMDAPDLDPVYLPGRGGRPKTLTDREFVKAFLSTEPLSRKALGDMAAEKGLSRATTTRYLSRLVKSGAIACRGGFYWVPQASG